MAEQTLAVHAQPRRESPRRLPLVTLYLTERCNSRCVTCDYWRHGRIDMNLASIARLLPSLEQLGTRLVVLSGGEPLLHPDWAAIARLLEIERSRGVAAHLGSVAREACTARSGIISNHDGLPGWDGP